MSDPAAPTSRPPEREHAQRCTERAQLRLELIASISHELRTPLTSVVGYSEVLLSGDAGELNAEQMAMLGRVASSGERLLHLIESLLCAATDHAGKVEDGDAVDVIEVVCGAIGEPSPHLQVGSPGPARPIMLPGLGR